ncbi:hypothetical protein CKAH01_10681 [Colletotrichum kahawae]|uniref:Uncharacterized protein n=1 Tax=Colletotrichum kahawae TaxID=34407 RepID=A0AAE0CYI4_COLKA|nr:hypothetical protein CKAH01_10681 [Colletotrichum kahawae]
MDSTLSNYKTVQKYNGKFQLLLHDLWGTDFTDETMEWPGDNGDWANYDRFLDTVIGRIIANDMLPGLYIDIWNEPEWGFWKRPQAQWLDMFGRTTNRFRYKTTHGYRAGTTGSEDRTFDAYATVGNDKVHALAGVRVKTGTWALTFRNLSAVCLPPAGELNIQTWGFTYEIPEAELVAPTDRGIATHSYANDEITIAIYQTEEDWKTAWAFEFLV